MRVNTPFNGREDGTGSRPNCELPTGRKGAPRLLNLALWVDPRPAAACRECDCQRWMDVVSFPQGCPQLLLPTANPARPAQSNQSSCLPAHQPRQAPTSRPPSPPQLPAWNVDDLWNPQILFAPRRVHSSSQPARSCHRVMGEGTSPTTPWTMAVSETSLFRAPARSSTISTISTTATTATTTITIARINRPSHHSTSTITATPSTT